MTGSRQAPREEHEEERAGQDSDGQAGNWIWVCPVSACDTRLTGDADGPEKGDGRCPIHHDRTLHRKAP